MLFPYTYVPHQMDRMQEFIDFIFYEVWCKAPNGGPYSIDLFASNPDLHEVMTAFHYADTQVAQFFAGSVERIYAHFTKLNFKQIRRIKWWYASNNQIECLCHGQAGYHATLYSNLSQKYHALQADVESFFKGLYGFDPAALKKQVTTLDEHYDSFFTVNDSGVCPFCGINPIKGKHHSTRDAYDHYLPKDSYPFNSVNFYNLVPTCHDCNSSYKGTKSPVHDHEKQRRKAFYPFNTKPYAIELEVNLLKSDIERLEPNDIALSFGPDAIREEIETWKEVYAIEERYKAKLCGKKNGSKYWLTQVLDECKRYGVPSSVALDGRAQLTEENPFSDENFLRMPFLRACQRMGLFDASS